MKVLDSDSFSTGYLVSEEMGGKSHSLFFQKSAMGCMEERLKDTEKGYFVWLWGAFTFHTSEFRLHWLDKI